MTSPQPLPSTVFKTDQSDGEERFEAWRQSISVVFDVAPLTPQAVEGFDASVQATHLGMLLLGDLHFSGQQFSRQRARVARDGLDHYLVQWYRGGGFVGQYDDGKDIEVRAGDITVLDLSRTLRTFAQPSHVMSLIVPRALADEAFGSRALGLHGTVLRTETPLGGLFSDHLLSLQRRLPAIALEDAPQVARASVQMLAACVRPGADTQAHAQEAVQGVALERIQRHIARHLGTALSPEGLCNEFGISRSVLYRLFEPLGGVAHYVQQRRLLQSFHTLVNPASRRLRVAEVAARTGFASNAHFSRAFRAAFGMSPSDARAMALSAASAGAMADVGAHPLSSVEYATWLRSLKAR
ncbi:helix-turn-helix domain-containing protein [Acidovorax sp. 1608163]|uniref:helix-turn-helix domain-containing protein n=1 Tax=Acidovorax sp. 1608163 TaxID=2478662 RepID=UPI000EF69832|nr:helix-turn-helix domain-containing protein [Acidovorax sp. 1608163]AYM94840.1 helix-turn-helix domain-containing protein [Acidovorax sp. 1608163]